ncbi:MAG: hypothetical protein Q7R70_03210 [Candidatus Diapherotrites archaeon]|nr:hypothetical protein [Candidatus Diapherotrites archaeon]
MDKKKIIVFLALTILILILFEIIFSVSNYSLVSGFSSQRGFPFPYYAELPCSSREDSLMCREYAFLVVDIAIAAIISAGVTFLIMRHSK